MNRALLLIPIFTLILSCDGNRKDPQSLAEKHCSACHSYPDPSLLNKNSWKDGVFPEMAFRMGIDFSKLHTIDENEFNEILRSLPDAPMVTKEEWKTIEEYYIKNAPDSLVNPPAKGISKLHQFTATSITLPISSNNLLTILKYDVETTDVFIGTRQGKLFTVKASMALKDSLDIGSPPSAILTQADGLMISAMGIMDPNDQAAGKIIHIEDGNPHTIIDSLKRPVYFEEADLNNDGVSDLLVSAFGNFTGALLAFEKIKDGYREHVIHNFPGTRKTIVRDFNEDGLPDILALITQGDEHIALFTNRGKFRFSYQVLLRFPPVYGSSFFELCDFNADGHPDILYTNGDNADYSAILKPYHGVRIFLNDGRNKFRESWFYPMHGASMARAADFDQDGDIDIAAISFFPDFRKTPDHSFLYLENNGESFTPHKTTLAASARWISMEVADIDSDRDLDIILAALNFSPGVPDSLMQEWKENPTSLLVLRNNLHASNLP
jgi:hypothetical protein